MLCRRFRLGADEHETASEIRALVPAGETVSEAVAEIIAGVRSGGDEALLDYTRRFGAPGAAGLRADGRGAAAAIDPELRSGLELAIANVELVARAALNEDRSVTLPAGHTVSLRHAPVASAAVYVPGGRAPYPSSVVMGVVTAVVAGVQRIVVCTPPAADGNVHAAVLAACELAGAHEIVAAGGAQVIAALAYGTETISPVDVIVGPGNLYVQEAKRQLSGRVGIDGFAGPSDLVVVADRGAEAELIALDLLAQAEHGPGTLVVAISSSEELLAELAERLAEQAETGAVVALVSAPGSAAGVALAQELAPEHLELIGPECEALAELVTCAGCVFLGSGSATAFGDYVAGSNHTLPTGGAARFASGLNPGHFRRTFAQVRIGEQAAQALARAAAPIARAEGFELHARSMEARIRENPSR